MSLAVLADHMASKGRGPDSMLIHMSPREVQGLQALAMQHGGSLTINPDTGLPEAGFLDKLLPAIIGFAVTATTGLPAWQVGLGIGAEEAVRTGDLTKGITRGLQAYSGGTLGGNLADVGASTIGAQTVADAAAANQATVAGTFDAGQGILPADAEALQKTVAEKMANASPYEKMAAGFDSAKANPLATLKANALPLAGAVAPAVLAEMNVKNKLPTTTTKPGMIRPYTYDPYGGGYIAGNPYEAAPTRVAEGGVIGFDESSNSPMSKRNTEAMDTAAGMFNYAHDDGGIIRMADGGLSSIIKMAGGTPPEMLTDEQLYQKTGSWEAAAAARDAQNNALNQYNWAQQAAAQQAAAPAPQTQQAAAPAPIDYNKLASQYVTSAAVPTETAEQFISGANKAGIGLTQPLQTALANSGLSAAAQYALTHADIGMPQNTAEDYGGLAGLSSNINYGVNTIRKAGLTGADARANALAEMNKYGLNEADILRATGKTVAELFPDVKKPTTVVPSGYYGNDTGNPLTTTPGDITTNPDGTVTIAPNIPGRPAGGFPGMAAVRDAYTAGGGSLGYTSPTYDSLKAVENKYPLSGGSKAAYDYLTGKTPYSPTPWTPTGEVQKPYAEAVLGMPANTSKKMYIFDPATKTYKINPDYAIPTYDSKGNRTYNVTNKDVITYLAGKPSNADFYAWAKANNLSVEQIAAATGMPITEVQKMFTSGAPADTTATTGGGSSGSTTDNSYQIFAEGGLAALTMAGGGMSHLGDYSDGGRLLKGPGDGVSDSIPAVIGNKQPARLADGEFVVPARIVSELGNGSTEAGARKLYGMMDRIQAARRGTVGKGKVAKNSRADKYLPA